MVEYGHHAQNDRWAIEAVFPNLQQWVLSSSRRVRRLDGQCELRAGT